MNKRSEMSELTQVSRRNLLKTILFTPPILMFSKGGLFAAEDIQPVFKPRIVPPGQKIRIAQIGVFNRGNEVHNDTDQFFRIDEGEGKVVIDNGREEISVKDGFSILIKQGTYHNVINTSSTKMLKLYSLYAPPHHPDGTVHKTKEEAEAEEAKEG